MNRRRVLSRVLFVLPLVSGLSGSAQTRQAAVAASTGTSPTQVKVAERPIAPFTVWQLRPGDSTETQVTPVQLNPSGYWLMVYIDPSSKRSRELLTQIQTLATTLITANPAAPTGTLPAAVSSIAASAVGSPKIDASKLVIIAAHASGAELSQFELNYPGLAAAAWTHDSKSAAAHLLGIRGTPHVFGMREGQQRWQLAESLQPADLEPVLTTWAGYNRLPQNKLTRHKPTPPASLAAAKTAQTTTATSQGPSR